jgi:hypothetical protein
MLPSLTSHCDYVFFVNDSLKSIEIPKAHTPVPEKLALLDLTPIRLLMLDLYCPEKGRIGYAPEDLLRTFLAMVFCGITSPSTWVEDYLQDSSGFYATISGFEKGDVPSVGCLYQFIDRLMQLPRFCKANQMRFKRKRLSKTQKQQLKDDKTKVTKRHVGIVAKLASRFSRIHANAQDVYVPADEQMANAILQCCCLTESQRRSLLDKKHLFVVGDGTKLPVHGNSYGKRVCSCDDKNCDCKRYYNAPDASIGYDAYRDVYVYSHNLYQLTSVNHSHTYELPTYLMMTTGCRHDSVTGSFAMNRATQRMSVDKACFDAAHDATAFYQMAHDLWQSEVFIPLNTTNEGNFKQVPMATISPKGIPICREGHQMYYAGHCKDRDTQKWRCPNKATKSDSTDCKCSTSDYGRVVYTHTQENLRIFPKTPRSSPTFKKFYNHRTAAERVFKRQKLDFKLTFFKTRSKGRHLFYALLTAIAVHIETWYRLDSPAT